MTDTCLIVTTCGSEETALTIAASLVDQGFAACVNILPSIKSYYFFKGETQLDEEVMLMIKTTSEMFPKVSEIITDLHTYEIPEILMFPVSQGSEPFLDWIRGSVRQRASA
ncbi:MAG: divalent-cation tolerance protein CutA [Acidobacteria bacterium]|nr:divalent-cation tolerance protein CutA [Acidobacteriota bacterium]